MKADPAEITTIDEYIGQAPEGVRPLLRSMRATIRKAAPEATEKISYRVPTFYEKGNLVHFAGFRNHIGFFPTPSGIAAFKKELSGFKGSKGSVQFPIGEPLPLKLVAQIVKYRVKENAAKNPKKSAKTSKRSPTP